MDEGGEVTPPNHTQSTESSGASSPLDHQQSQEDGEGHEDEQRSNGDRETGNGTTEADEDGMSFPNPDVRIHG